MSFIFIVEAHPTFGEANGTIKRTQYKMEKSAPER